MHPVTVNMASCKYNSLLKFNLTHFFLCSGLKDKESRTAFQHVANIGAKNIYRAFAGGNHSWVVIDEIIPIRTKYRPPSPVPDNKQMVIQGVGQPNTNNDNKT